MFSLQTIFVPFSAITGRPLKEVDPEFSFFAFRVQKISTSTSNTTTPKEPRTMPTIAPVLNPFLLPFSGLDDWPLEPRGACELGELLRLL